MLESTTDVDDVDEQPPIFGDVAFYLIVLAFVAYLYTLTRTYVWESARLPLLVIYATVVLSVVGLLKIGLRFRADDTLAFRVPPVEEVRARFTDAMAHHNGLRVAFYFALVIVYSLLASKLGLFTSTAAFAFVHVYYNKRDLLKSVGVSILLVVLLYLLFVEALNNGLLIRDDIVTNQLLKWGVL